jgi:2'-5' RNA ligase
VKDGHILGVALEVPEPWGPQLRSARAEYGDAEAMVVPPHITLLPPTTVDHEVLPGILAHLRGVAEATEPFEILLRGTGTFRPISDVVFVMVARGISECESLERRVRSGLLERPLAFPYHPHVTIAHDVDAGQLDRAFAEMSGFSAAFTADRLRLYRHVDGAWLPESDLLFTG